VRTFFFLFEDFDCVSRWDEVVAEDEEDAIKRFAERECDFFVNTLRVATDVPSANADLEARYQKHHTAWFEAHSRSVAHRQAERERQEYERLKAKFG
jgi:hypothetical protein